MSGFGSTPTTTTEGAIATNQVYISSVAVPGHAGGNLTALEGGPASNDSNNNETAPVSTYTKDGGNVTQGAKADPAATDSTSAWSIVSLLKGIFAKLAGTLTISGSVTVGNANANGQSTMANSAPVAVASDQSAISVKRSAVPLFSTTQTTQPSGNSGDIQVGPYTAISIDMNLTAVAGTNPTIQFFWERKGIADNIYYPIWQSDLVQGLPANPTAISTSIGAGMEWSQFLGSTGRLRWVVGGTVTPTYTFTPNVQGN